MRILLALVFVLSACSKKKDEAPAPAPASGTKSTDPAPDEKPTPTESKPAPTGDAPSKEAGIQRLKDVLAALEAKDYAKATGYFVLPAGAPADQVAEQLGKLIELKEISAPGIEVVATKGKWGKLAVVFEPERAAKWAERSGVAVDQCWGFSVDGGGANASVGFHWDGKELKVIRLNNVGKL